MANLVSEELRTTLLASFFKGAGSPSNLYLRLFTDGADIVEGTTLASLTAAGLEQAGGGYATKTLAASNWTVSTGVGGIKVQLDDQTWTTTADNWGTLRWGVICTGPEGVGGGGVYPNTILMARDYSTGKTVTGVGANVTVDDLFYQINN